MRILFNTYPVAFDCPGGGEMQLLKTKSALESMGVQIDLYNPWAPRFDNIDVAHYFSVQGGSINFCSYVKKLGIPLAISPIIWLGDDKQSYPLEEIGELFRLSDIIFPNSYAEKDLIMGHYAVADDKFCITHNAVEGKRFCQPVKDSFKRKYDIKDEFVLNVANIEKRKNQLNLIKALKHLDMTLVLIGEIREKAYFDQCMDEGFEKVKYIGYLNNEDPMLVSAYQECCLFALPSLLETPSLSALEAAVSGSKIVITEIGCTKEYFGDHVQYVNPYDVDSIKNGIIKEVNNTRAAGLKDHVIGNFTWKRTGDEVLQGYKTAIKRNEIS